MLRSVPVRFVSGSVLLSGRQDMGQLQAKKFVIHRSHVTVDNKGTHVQIAGRNDDKGARWLDSVSGIRRRLGLASG